MSEKMHVGLCQMNVGTDKDENIVKAKQAVVLAKQMGADVAVLPEMFNCPYDITKFFGYAERTDDGKTMVEMCECARRHSIAIAAGSIPEIDQGRLFNTQCLIDHTGRMIAKHRKVHLFDMDVKDKVTVCESAVLSAGDSITDSMLQSTRVGLGICYDIRFPEYFRILATRGVKVTFLPAAFNLLTGPAHWETVLRCRALDNCMFIVAVSPARAEHVAYIAYGHSMVVSPWGEIVAECKTDACVKVVPIDLSLCEKTARQLPLMAHRRTDLYDVCEKKAP